jgi:hypothetical protein
VAWLRGHHHCGIWDPTLHGEYQAYNAGYPVKNYLKQTQVQDIHVEGMTRATTFIDPPIDHEGDIFIDMKHTFYLLSSFNLPYNIVLPNANDAGGRWVTFKKNDLHENPITIKEQDGLGPDRRELILLQQFDTVTLVSNGANWWILADNRTPALSTFVDSIMVYQNGGVGYVARKSITAGTQFIDSWKVFTGRAAPGTGNKDTYPHKIISTPFIGEPGSISSETYLCIGPLESKAHAESVLSYLSCRLTRFLILLHKPSQDTTRRVYTFVPKQNFSKPWTDEKLYKKYDLNKDEIAFIESMVRPMDNDLLGEITDE